VVYTVANEGSRLDIPEGPLGRLISGLQLSNYSRPFFVDAIILFRFHLVYLVTRFLYAECWAEPHERPSCEEILSRLVDIQYSLF